MSERPGDLARHYGRFRVTERVLLTGHSHQAWPDCGFEAQQRAWLDAAELVDDKWERAFAQAEKVRDGWRLLLDDPKGEIALAGSTHDLVIRFLSALPLRERPRIVTTDGEFHTLRRQLDRLAEEGLEIVKVAAHPVDRLAERLAGVVDDRTAAVAVSTVMFQSAHIVPGLGLVARACARHGAELLLDTYHSLNVVPFSIPREGFDSAFVVGGGYKYCQLGEGNCFLRVPPGCSLRPAVTGWFAEFDALTEAHGKRVAYADGAARFAGATYDPTSHYRAAAVFDFFAQQGLDAARLRAISRHQIALLAERFDALDLDSAVIARDDSVPLEDIGGFLALRTPWAGRLSAALRGRDVFTDYRENVLRLGPAPYCTDGQLDAGIQALAAAVREVPAT